MTSKANVIDIFLMPGDHFVGDQHYRVRTLLGSCVSITLWHRHRKIGAMSHFLLSNREPRSDSTSELDGRYAEEAMWLMLQKLEEMNIAPHECEGKIFGGGNMFPVRARTTSRNIGQVNGEAARALLRAHHVPIVSESLFGIGRRNIFFNISNGDVWAHHDKNILKSNAS